MNARKSRLAVALDHQHSVLVSGRDLPTAELLEAVKALVGTVDPLDLRLTDPVSAGSLRPQLSAAIKKSKKLVVLLAGHVPDGVSQVLREAKDGHLGAKPQIIALLRGDPSDGGLGTVFEVRLTGTSALQPSPRLNEVLP